MSEAAEGQSRRARRMDRIDNMPADLRACVHEYGLTIVDACLDSGVRRARAIHHLVRVIRSGSAQSVRDSIRTNQERDAEGKR